VDENDDQRASVLDSHRVPAHLARRFNQICLGVTAEILDREDINAVASGASSPPSRKSREAASAIWQTVWASMP